MLFISLILLIVALSFNFKINTIHFTRISSLILLYAGALSFNVYYIQSIGSGIGIYNGLFQINQINQGIEILMLIVGSLILLSWPKILKVKGNVIEYITSDNYSTNYSIIVLFSIFGSSLLMSSFDLISIYLSIELQSFGLYILSTLYRNSESATNAGLKYFLLGALSSCLILLGSGIVYSYTGSTNLESIYLLNSVSSAAIADAQGLDVQNYMIQGLSLGLIIIFIGFLFKIAAAPLHNWSPDVYDEVPTIVTTWLTIIPKLSILILLLELLNNLSQTGISISTYFSSLYIETEVLLKNLLLISSLLSLIIGSILGLSQIKIKRLLAYSTINHIGFILLALAINSEQSIDSFLFYIIQYTITNLNIFLIILGLSYLRNTSASALTGSANITNNSASAAADINYISEFTGLFKFNPLLSISLAICLFSMAGVPPLLGFFSKQFVLYSALQNGYYFISIIAIIVSVISASYYLQIIKNIYHIETEDALAQPANNFVVAQLKQVTGSSDSYNSKAENNSIFTASAVVLSNTHSYIISTITLFILLFFIKPSILLNSTQLLALSLFYI